MFKTRLFRGAGVLLLVIFCGVLEAGTTKPVIFTSGGNPVTGWERDGDGKIKIKVWLDSLNAEQKRVFGLAMNQWVSWKTVDTDLAKSNYDDDTSNKDVMSGEELPSGESGRNLSETDVNGAKQLYDGTTIEVEYVDNEADANYKVELSNQTDFGYGSWTDTDGDGDIDKGSVLITDSLEAGFSWYYVTDSDGDGKITNADKDAAGKSIEEYTTDTGNGDGTFYYNKYDFYSLVKHEIGHTLGFDHSVTVPAPPAVLLAMVGVGIVGKIRRVQMYRSENVQK